MRRLALVLLLAGCTAPGAPGSTSLTAVYDPGPRVLAVEGRSFPPRTALTLIFRCRTDGKDRETELGVVLPDADGAFSWRSGEGPPIACAGAGTVQARHARFAVDAPLATPAP